MKAEHRRELQTNALADSVGRLIQEVRSHPQSTSIALWVLGVVAVVVVVVWYFTSGSSASRSTLWAQIEADSYVRPPAEAVEDLSQVAAYSPKTIPGRTARFQEARLLLPQALQTLATPGRAEAIKDLLRARELYTQLSTETGDNPLLQQESLMGAAKAEEALVGVSNPDKPETTYGSLDKALELYNKLAKTYPDSFLGEQAKAHAQRLEENKEQVVKFYTELNKRASASSIPPSASSIPPKP